MKKFKQILEESSRGQVYHTATMPVAEQIIQSNMLKAGLVYDGEDIQGISVTRNFKFARTFARIKFPVTFELDLDKLKTKYKVVPYSMRKKSESDKRSKRHNEFEERIITKQVTNLMKYVTKIYVSKFDQHKLADYPLINYDPRLEIIK